MSICIRAAKVIDKESPYHLKTVDIFIEKGLISAIGADLKVKAKKEIRYPDLCVSMGWTDLMADYCEPGYEHKETLKNGLKVAAKGGFTTVFLAPNTQPSISSKSIIQYLLTQSANQIVEALPMGSISANIEGKNLAEMLDMRSAGAVAFSDGWKPLQNPALMLKALEYVKAFDGIIAQIPMDMLLAEGGLMHEGPLSTQMGMPGIPSLAESLFLHRDIELLNYTNSRLHVNGIASADALNLVLQAKERKLNITYALSPYHLTLNDHALKSYDAVFKVLPPIRAEEDRSALMNALIKGQVDGICSLHRPQDWDAKSKEFEYAAYGMNLQEMVFPIIYQSMSKTQKSLEALIHSLANKPNNIFNLGKAGLQLNATANLTLFSTSLNTLITKAQSLSANNPYLNQSLKGKVIGIVNGNQIAINN